MGQYSQLDLPSQPMQQHIPTPPPAPPVHSPSPVLQRPPSPTTHTTEPDVFGVYREYTEWPTYIPPDVHVDDPVTLAECRPAHLVFGPGPQTSLNAWAPFANPTIFRLLKWFYNSDKKTLDDLDHLIYDVLLQQDFSAQDCEDFSAAREAHHLDKPDVFHSDIWKEDSVQISLPQKDFAWSAEEEAPIATIDGVWHRSLTEMLTSAFQDSSASDFHLKGYKELWKPSEESPAERIYAEVYMSPAYLEMEAKVCAAQAEIDAQMASIDEASSVDDVAAPGPSLSSDSRCLSQASQTSSHSSQISIDSLSSRSHDSESNDSSISGRSSAPSALPTTPPQPPPGATIENVVVPMILYTDSTHLTNFGSASLWPGYIFFGLLSKYISAIPEAHAVHHFVYMPEVSSTICCNQSLFIYVPFV